VSERAPLADGAARRRAVADFSRPLAVEAGAGSGKTTTLARRIVAWLLGPGWEGAASELAERGGGAPAEEIAGLAASGVVALTFSEKAAHEMSEKVVDLLGALEAALANGADSDRLRGEPDWDWLPDLGARALARVRATLSRLDGLALRTIHSYCLGLLARHPFEARLHPGFAVDADGTRARAAIFEVLSVRLPEAFAAGEESALRRLALAGGVDSAALAEALQRALAGGLTSADLAGDPFSAPAIVALAARLGAAADALAAELPPLDAIPKGSKIARALGEALPALRPALEAVTTTGPGALAALQRLATAEAGPAAAVRRFGARSANAVGEGEREALGSALEDCLERAVRLTRLLDHVAALDPAAWRAARDAFSPLLGEVRERLRREGALSFQELLAAADRLLADESVARRERRRIRQFLVDEFQDTDELQCRLVERLALDGEPAERPGLFVVGDPKQSIYGWRSARLDAYEAFLARLVAQGGERLELTVNFRSDRPLLAEVNALIAQVMVPEAGLQPSYVALQPGPEAGDGAAARSADAAPVEVWPSAAADALRGQPTSTSAATSARLEAAAIARDLAERRLRRAEASWSERALLFRSGDVDEYLRALREADIPFVVEKDRSFYRRREVVDAVALVRAVLDPADGLAFVTLLRAPFVGVPDAALLPLWRRGVPALVATLEGPDEPLLERLRAELTAVAGELPPVPGLERVAGWELSAAAALEALAHARGAAHLLPADQFVETLRRLFLPEATTAARYLGAFGLANLDRFFRELAADLDAAGGDRQAVLRELRLRLRDEAEDAESRPPGTAADAVRVLTVHSAKGLEFDEVYLPALTRRGRPRNHEEALVAERLDGRFELRLFGLATPAFDRVVERRLRLERAESVRLLYVAMTRARHRLVLAGNTSARGGAAGSLWSIAWSGWQALGRGFEARTAELVERAEHRETHSGDLVLHLPALDTRAAPAPAAAPRTPEPDFEVIEAEAREVALRRERARARSARARLDRASHVAGFEPEPMLAEDHAEVEELGRSLARARGTALHRALELAPAAALDAAGWRARAAATWRAERPGAAPAELASLDADLDRLLASALWARLAGLAPHVLARELPLVVAADEESETGPVDGWAGALDLLYRDAGSGEIVVADFKSDAVSGDPAAAEKVARYAPQLRLYGEAVRSALGLARPPRLELWLLALDRVEVVPPADTAAR